MLTPNTNLRLHYGTTVRIGQPFGGGGEGIVYHATDTGTGEPGVLKVFKNRSRERAQRVKFLVDQRLGGLSPLFCAPIDFCDNGCLSHFAPLAPGVSLEQHLETPGNNYGDTLCIAIAYAHGHALLLEHEIVYADPGLANANAHFRDGVWHIYFLDFDNFAAKGLPAPSCFGQEDRMAPELRVAMSGGPAALPDEFTDRYAIATVLHDLLLAKSLAAGFDHTAEEFNRAMAGGWPHDPARGPSPADSGGYPSTILSSELASAFRRAFSLVREERPTPAEWRALLSRGIYRLCIDERCGQPSFVDPSRTHCPACNQPFPVLALVFSNLGLTIPCDRAAIAVGRRQLKSPKVSELHATLHRCGQECTLTPRGRNGTFRWNGSAWLPLTTEVVLSPGDRLRFADVECLVRETR